MTKQTKRYYHDGDGVIREVITTDSNLRKDKIKQTNNKEKKTDEQRSSKNR